MSDGDQAAPPPPRRAYLLTAAAAALLVAQQVASKATRDALFLVSFTPRRLPLVMGAGAVISFVVAVLIGRALARFPPRRVVQLALLVHAALYVVELAVLSWVHAGVGAAILYLHVAGMGGVLISAFWSVVSDGVDPHRARSYLARVTGGAALGGVVGGLGARALAGVWDGRAMLVVVAVASVACALLLSRVPVTTPERRAAEAPPAKSVLGVVAGSSYLRALAVLTVLVATWEALLDFALKNGAAQTLHDPKGLVSFFALFYTATSLATFLLQAVAGRTVLRRAGVGMTLVSLPVLVLGGLAALLGAPFPLTLALQGGEGVLANSVFRSAYEVLFTPIASETKRRTKTVVDVAAARIGDGLGALMVLAIVTWWPLLSARMPLVLAGGLGLVGIWVVHRVARGYVDTLGNALRAGTVAMMLEAHVDATTRRTVLATTSSLEQERAAERERARAQPALAARFAALCDGDDAARHAVLTTKLEPELVRAALPLLAPRETAADALAALRAVAPSHVGLLTDALLDPELPREDRVRIPQVLLAVADPRVAHSLQLGVAHPDRDVRFHSARALAQLVAKDSAFAPPTDVLLAAVKRELDEPGAADGDLALDLCGDAPTALDELLALGAVRKYANAFTLLSMVVEVEPLQLALRGLSSGDERLRGTALELLENILPEPVRDPLMAAFARAPRGGTQARTRAEILAELGQPVEAVSGGGS